MAETKQDEEHGDFNYGHVWHIRSTQGSNERQRRSTDRNKSDLSHLSPLSSIKAAFKKTSTKSQGDSAREKRHPEITIVSVEPLHATSWFAGTPEKFPAHSASLQTSWDGGVDTSGQSPPSYDQVIQEKTQEKKPTPTAAPRRSHSSSIATQTVEDRNTHRAERNTSGESQKKPKKPPRSTLPQKIRVFSTPTPADSDANQTANQRSPQSISDESQFVLVSLQKTEPHSAKAPPHLHPPLYEPPLSWKQLQELLEVFEPFDPAHTEENQSEEDLIESMAALHSERNIRDKIKEFERQMGTEELSKPTPQPRSIYASKPVVASKPSVSPQASISTNQEKTNPQSTADENDYEEFLDNFTNPTPTPPSPAQRPVLLRKPSLNSNDKLKPQLNSSVKSAPPLPSRPTLQRSNPLSSQEEDDVFTSPPFSSSTVNKELLNVNNHYNTQSKVVDTFASQVPATLPRGAGGFTNTVNPPTRKPTIIRVPSKKEEEVTFPNALPVQRPLGGSLRAPPSTRCQNLYSSGSQPSLPQRPAGGKVLPPRPPPAKFGPGRPPPPRRANTLRNAPLQSRNMKPVKKGPVLPTRPNPGHLLYNKYTLEIPHGIAEFNYNGMQAGELSFQKNEVLVLLNQVDSNTFECQVGDAKGTVQKTHMKIITPLSPYSYHQANSEPQERSQQAFGYSAENRNLRVQALYDFVPEGSGELGLRAGDIINNVEQLDSEWYLGTSRGITGFFPINYVKPLSGFSAPVKAPFPAQSLTNSVTQKVSGPRCVARFDFEGENSDELSFNEGEEIQLLEYLGDEWARGGIGGHVGIFPLNFVEVIEDLPATSERNQGKIALPGMTASYSMQAAASTSNQVERVLALYDFTAETTGDLPFLRGAVIEVIDHIDEEWCRGRLKGREGIFPKSFTQPHTGGFPR